MDLTSNWDPSLPAPAEEDVVKCVACGLCLPHCPTFRLTGRETASPRGRIAAMRAVEEGHAEVDASFTTMMDECLACRACEAACPSGVPFGRMIEAARAQAEPTRAVSRARREAPGPGRRAAAPAPGVGGRLDDGRGPARCGSTVWRPAAQRATDPAGEPARAGGADPPVAGLGPTAKVLSGCVMDVAFRPAQRATHAGGGRGGLPGRAHPGAAACCGALAMHYGQPEAARRMARERIAELEDAEMSWSTPRAAAPT